MATYIRSFEFIDREIDFTVKGTGWRMLDTPTFDPLNVAYGVVHDAIEHYEAGEEGIENEMMAFGSIYHIRVQGKWWDQFGMNVNANKMMAWDIARFLHELDFVIAPCPSKTSKALNDFCVEAFPHYVAQLAKHYSVEEHSDQMVRAMHAFQQACAWMSRGYARSLKRWHGNTPSALTDLFNSLTSLIERVTGKHGDLLKVSFDTKSLDHKCEHLVIVV
jgi:hypothetical protein